MTRIELFNWIVGRVKVAPIEITERQALVGFLEKNATRTESRLEINVPLLSRAKGFVFFEDERSVFMYDFVPGNKIDVMCPPPFCGRQRDLGRFYSAA